MKNLLISFVLLGKTVCVSVRTFCVFSLKFDKKILKFCFVPKSMCRNTVGQNQKLNYIYEGPRVVLMCEK